MSRGGVEAAAQQRRRGGRTAGRCWQRTYSEEPEVLLLPLEDGQTEDAVPSRISSEEERVVFRLATLSSHSPDDAYDVSPPGARSLASSSPSSSSSTVPKFQPSPLGSGCLNTSSVSHRSREFHVLRPSLKQSNGSRTPPPPPPASKPAPPSPPPPPPPPPPQRSIPSLSKLYCLRRPCCSSAGSAAHEGIVLSNRRCSSSSW